MFPPDVVFYIKITIIAALWFMAADGGESDMGALVLLLICAGNLTKDQCTPETARVSVSIRLDQISCGIGAISASYRLKVGDDEFVRVICRMK